MKDEFVREIAETVENVYWQFLEAYAALDGEPEIGVSSPEICEKFHQANKHLAELGEYLNEAAGRPPSIVPPSPTGNETH